jgi:hypothetical protein
MEGGVNSSETGDDDVLADELSESEPHAASIMTSDAAQAATAAEDTRETFTVVTLPPRLGSQSVTPGPFSGVTYNDSKPVALQDEP